MNETVTPSSAPRRHVGLALLLSFLCSGLGQIYAGRGRRGVVLLVLALVHAPALFVLSYVGPSMGVLAIMGALLLFGFGLFVFVLVDAALCAKRAAVPYVPRVYNNAWLYVLLIVLTGVWEIGGMVWARDRAFQAFKIPTESMSPTIGRGDRVLVNMRRAGHLERGDVIVYHAPGDRRRHYIKRVIGLPGEELLVQAGGIHVDGRPLGYDDEGHGVLLESDGARSWRIRWGIPAGRSNESPEPVTVPPGHVYVLGDNRDNSMDSRRHGPVPLGDVEGVAEYVIWAGPDGTFGPIR